MPAVATEFSSVQNVQTDCGIRLPSYCGVPELFLGSKGVVREANRPNSSSVEVN
jgi:hypothetical protein